MIFFPISDNLNLVSQELVKLAKDNGSTDNISIGIKINLTDFFSE